MQSEKIQCVRLDEMLLEKKSCPLGKIQRGGQYIGDIFGTEGKADV